MAVATRPQDAKKTTAKAGKQPAQVVSESPTVTTPECPKDDVGVQPAYLAYVDARKGLANAFRGRERHDREAYEDSERCYQAYEQAVEKAIKARQKSEREALSSYKEALEKAAEDYRARMNQALLRCKQATEDGWKASMQTSASMTNVFENDEKIEASEDRTEGNPGLAAALGTIRGEMLILSHGCVSLLRRGAGPARRLLRGNSHPTEATTSEVSQ